jgi:hypothetical protein
MITINAHTDVSVTVFGIGPEIEGYVVVIGVHGFACRDCLRAGNLRFY